MQSTVLGTKKMKKISSGSIMWEEIAAAFLSFIPILKKILEFEDFGHFLSVWVIIAEDSGLNYTCNTVNAQTSCRQASVSRRKTA